MCLAIPVRILSIDHTIAEVELNGTKTKADISLVPDVRIGDYVIIHAGLAIQRYDEEEALKTLELLRQLAESVMEE
jgi:hydrogenase expression/formation protein HypC